MSGPALRALHEREPSDLAARIERVYLALTGATSPRGARAWFARRAGVVPYTVSRWLSGEREPGGPVLALLAALEHEAGERAAP